ncbi:hypothetical protein [Sphingobium sp. C100]|uniref:hypothetical protein n=1 Tax=Sphingobium sp. C100 TaxID=1207055 RepID=UPI001377836B|nr:hypothetical protein [Sphingobium sp. C100]
MAQMAAIRNAKRPQQQEDETLSRLDDKQSSTDPAIERRLDKLEMMMADSISRLDRLQHLVELVMAECQARRLDHAARPEGGTRWSAAGFPLLARNHPVDFSSDTVPDADAANPDDYLASGWFVREPWGVWGRDAIQGIRFALDDYRGGYVTVSLSLQCFVPPGAERPAIDISANGYFLGTHRLGAMLQIVKLRLPPSCIGDGDILLQLQHEAPLSPVSAGASPDPRILGVGLASLDVS